MPSNINPNNIDGTYPVAGQDNDSQGFRDNFTNIKNNFRFASNEISDLQSKVVLKAALSGATLNNDMGGSILSNTQLRSVSESVVAFGSQSGTLTLNYTTGSFFTVTTAGSVSAAFSNFTAAGTLSRLRLRLDVTNTAHTLTLPSAVSIGVDKLAGYSDNVITFNRTGFFEYEFETSDNGATVAVFDLTSNPDPLYLPNAESVSSGDAVSVDVTTSHFTTTAASTATMPAGVPGQIKILAMRSFGGNMVVTVANPGWDLGGSSGTITFGAQGQSCILQYIDGRWFVIGNNGSTFA